MAVGNGIGAEGAKALAAKLEKNTALKTLDLRGKQSCRVVSVQDICYVCVRFRLCVVISVHSCDNVVVVWLQITAWALKE